MIYTEHIGCIAESVAGRDKKRYYAIIGVPDSFFEDGIVLIADGRLRCVDSPKKKKLKHLKIISERNEAILELIQSGKLTNKALWSILREYGKAAIRL